MGIQICAGALGQVAAGFDAHLDIGEGVANDLMVDNRLVAEPTLRAGEIEDVIKGRAHCADAGCTNECGVPAESPGDDGDAVPLGTNEVLARNAHILKDDLRLTVQPEVDLILDLADADA